MSKILIYPNKILKKKAMAVKTVDENLMQEIEDLKKQLIAAENGVALAAPQIGVSKRFLGIKDGNNGVKVFLNPRIVKTYSEKVFPMIKREKPNSKALEENENFLEGCLSFPTIFGTVKRWLKIGVEWQEVIDKKLVSKSGELVGFEAIVWQHESDHLDGILLIDHLKNEKGKVYKVMGDEMIDWSIEKVINNKLI